MSPILPAPPSLGDLLREHPTALLLDFDGTLVDLAPTPDGIVLSPRLAERLVELSARIGGRLALVSGRDIENLEAHLGSLRIACAGSHGAEVRTAAGQRLGSAALPLPPKVIELVSAWARREGADFEAKPHGAALHSRGRPDLEPACALFLEGLAESHGLTVKRGKFVAELIRPGPDKGAAVHSLMGTAPFAGARPVFLGDDVTDEDGFAAARDLGGLAIAVGPRPAAQADYALADPAAVHQWLGL